MPPPREPGIAGVFSVRGLAGALQYAFNPNTRGAGIEGHDLVLLAIWLAVGVVLMFRFLRTSEA